jgi:hypothetical protein
LLPLLLVALLQAGDPDLEGMPPPPDADLEGMPPPPGDAGLDAPPGLTSGFSPTVRFGGRLRLEAAFDLAHDGGGEDVFESRERLDLEMAGQVTPALSALVAGRMTHVARTPAYDFGGARYAYEPELREAYATGRFGATVVTIGNQVVRWGSADANSPNDVVNPVDYREGLDVDLETPLVPVLAARATHTLSLDAGTLTFEGVYVPFFAPHRASLFGSDWAPVAGQPQFAPLLGFVAGSVPPSSQEDAQALLLSPDPPDESPKNGSAGGRLAWSGGGLDLRLNAFYGWDRIPELRVDPELVELLVAVRDNDLATLARLFPKLRATVDGGGLPFTSRYHRQATFGADGVFVAGDFAFKGDVAWTPARTLYTADLEPDRAAALSWAGGVDYMPSTTFQITLEAFGLKPLEGEGWYLVGDHLANLVGQLRWAPIEDELTLQVAAQYGLTREDVLVAPAVAWRPRDNHEAQVGAVFLEGPDDSAGGLFDANDHAYVRYALSF